MASLNFPTGASDGATYDFTDDRGNTISYIYVADKGAWYVKAPAGQGDNAVEEAPKDGNDYVRNNGDWVVAPDISGLDLQAVTDIGDTTTNRITAKDFAGIAVAPDDNSGLLSIGAYDNDTDYNRLHSLVYWGDGSLEGYGPPPGSGDDDPSFTISAIDGSANFGGGDWYTADTNVQITGNGSAAKLTLNSPTNITFSISANKTDGSNGDFVIRNESSGSDDLVISNSGDVGFKGDVTVNGELYLGEPEEYDFKQGMIVRTTSVDGPYTQVYCENVTDVNGNVVDIDDANYPFSLYNGTTSSVVASIGFDGTFEAINLSDGTTTKTMTEVLAGGSGGGFAAGTRMIFDQETPPTGWTIASDKDGHALRIVSSSGGTTGGTQEFTACFQNRSFSVGSISASGSATVTVPQTDGANPGTGGPTDEKLTGASVNGAGLDTNSNGSHSHTYKSTNGNAVYGFSGTASWYVSDVSTGRSGSGSAHGHGFSDPRHFHTLAQSNEHSHTFSNGASGTCSVSGGTGSGALDLAVKYTNVCIGVKS